MKTKCHSWIYKFFYIIEINQIKHIYIKKIQTTLTFKIVLDIADVDAMTNVGTISLFIVEYTKY